MKSAYITETGPPESIKVGELPTPAMGAEQVLVKVHAVAVDPIDTYIRRGLYKLDLPLPFIIGRDMVGTVSEVGCSVQGFKNGDWVWCNNQGYAGRQGTFSEYVCIDKALLYHLPEGVDPLNALASAHSALTVVLGLMIKAQLRADETLFINGGSGNVGICGIQLAKAMGAKVAVTAGSEEKAQWCRDAGADAVVNYKSDDVCSAVRKFAPAGVNVYWDLTQQPEVQTALSVLNRRGRVLLSSGMKHTSSFSIGDFYTRNCTIYGFTITDLNEAELAEYAELINCELACGTFKTRIAETLPLDQASMAHTLIEQGDVNGKLIVMVN